MPQSLLFCDHDKTISNRIIPNLKILGRHQSDIICANPEIFSTLLTSAHKYEFVYFMRTTVEIKESTFHRTKALASLRGISCDGGFSQYQGLNYVEL